MGGSISLITVNYNGLELTCALLDSLERVCSVLPEVIVVDNGSKTDEAAVIAQRHPFVKAVRSEENLGFAGGNNLGLKYATGDYILFINNDVEIKEDGFGKLVEAFSKDSSIGMVCPKIRFFWGTEPIQFAGYTPMRGIGMHNDMIGYMQEDDGSFDTPAFTPFAHGAAMMVSRRALEDVGPMPECYFLYYEELDWSLMFTRKGWKIYFEPAFTIFHKESATTGRESPLKSYYMARSRQLFAHRNFSGARRVLSICFARYLSGTKKILKALLKGRPELARAVLKANHDFRKMALEGRLG